MSRGIGEPRGEVDAVVADVESKGRVEGEGDEEDAGRGSERGSAGSGVPDMLGLRCRFARGCAGFFPAASAVGISGVGLVAVCVGIFVCALICFAVDLSFDFGGTWIGMGGAIATYEDSAARVDAVLAFFALRARNFSSSIKLIPGI